MFLLYIKISSIYIITNLSKNSLKISCIKVIKVAGALVSPKLKTLNSQCPYLVLKAIFY